jgi:hypothetical protein
MYERRLWPSDITLSPTASYRAVGDKEAVGCLLVYCSASWMKDMTSGTHMRANAEKGPIFFKLEQEDPIFLELSKVVSQTHK